MKFTIGKKVFLDELQKVRGAVDSNGFIPILSNLLIEVLKENGGLYISGTNTNLFAKGFCSAQVEEDGRFTVNAHRLFDIVRALPEEEVLICSDGKRDGWILLLCGNYSATLSGLPVDDFPEFPQYNSESLIKFGSSQLKELFKKISFSVLSDDNDIRTNMCGILFETDGDSIIRMVSTDGHRLSYIKTENVNTPNKFVVIIPRIFASEISKLLNGDEDVLFGLSERNIVFKKGMFVFVSNLIDAQFPNYKPILQTTETTGHVVFNKDELIHALRRVSVVSGELGTAVKLTVDKGRAKISNGDAEEDISVKYDGDPVVIGLNSEFILDVLSVIDNDAVNVSIAGSKSPIVVTSEDDVNYRHIVMPVVLNV